MLMCNISFAQENDSLIEDETSIKQKQKSFHAGVYVGSYWADKSSASLFDGYGFDEFGVRNTFANSLLYCLLYTSPSPRDS